MNSNDKYHYELVGLKRTYCGEGIYPTTKITFPGNVFNAERCEKCVANYKLGESISNHPSVEKIKKGWKIWEMIKQLFKK